MYVCMCVCMCACMYVCMCACVVCVCAYACMHVCLCMHARVCMHVCMGLIDLYDIDVLAAWFVRWLSDQSLDWLIDWLPGWMIALLRHARYIRYYLEMRSGAAGRISITPLGSGCAGQVRDEVANRAVRGPIPDACELCCALRLSLRAQHENELVETDMMDIRGASDVMNVCSGRVCGRCFFRVSSGRIILPPVVKSGPGSVDMCSGSFCGVYIQPRQPPRGAQRYCDGVRVFVLVQWLRNLCPTMTTSKGGHNIMVTIRVFCCACARLSLSLLPFPLSFSSFLYNYCLGDMCVCVFVCVLAVVTVLCSFCIFILHRSKYSMPEQEAEPCIDCKNKHVVRRGQLCTTMFMFLRMNFQLRRSACNRERTCALSARKERTLK